MILATPFEIWAGKWTFEMSANEEVKLYKQFIKGSK